MIRSLCRTERRWAFAALGAIYPSGASPALSIGVCDLDLGAYLRDVFRTIPLTAALGLRVAIWIVALAPPFVLGRMVTVLGLEPAERARLIEKLVASSSYGVRQLVTALKAVGGLLFGGAGSVQSAILGPPGDQGRPPQLLSPSALIEPRTSRDRSVSGAELRVGGHHVQPSS